MYLIVVTAVSLGIWLGEPMRFEETIINWADCFSCHASLGVAKYDDRMATVRRLNSPGSAII
jgi:hypothetical protein